MKCLCLACCGVMLMTLSGCRYKNYYDEYIKYKSAYEKIKKEKEDLEAKLIKINEDIGKEREAWKRLYNE